MGTLVSNRLKNKQFWSDIDKAIGNVSSLKKISNEKIKLKEKIAPADESLKDVLETKSFTDVTDKALICNMNENKQCVFKSSSLEIDITTNICKDNIY